MLARVAHPSTTLSRLTNTVRQLSDLLSRAQLAIGAGLSFKGKRNLYEVLGYKVNLTLKDYRERYDRNSIAARVVDAFPKSTWRGFVELIEDENPRELTEFEEAWVALANRLHVNSTFKRADILAGMGNYAVVVIGAPGGLEQPLPENLNPDDILYLQPYAQSDAPIDQYVSDQRDERFGLPLFYKINVVTDGPLIVSDSSKPTTKEVRVHWTRVVHFSDGLLDDNVLGTPRLRRVWNDLDDLEKVKGGGSEAFWMKANGGIVFDVDKDIKLLPEAKEELQKELDEYQHGQRRFLRTRGVTTQDLGSEAVDFSPQLKSLVSLISAGSEIPQRLLLGSERGELASTQDRENWKERVQDRRDEYAGPLVLVEFVDRLIDHGALPTPAEGYEVRWAEVHDETKMQQAELADKYAGLNKKAGETVITGDEIRDRVLGLPRLEDVLTPEELKRRQELQQQPKQVQPVEGAEQQPRAAAERVVVKSTLLLFRAKHQKAKKQSHARPAPKRRAS